MSSVLDFNNDLISANPWSIRFFRLVAMLWNSLLGTVENLERFEVFSKTKQEDKSTTSRATKGVKQNKASSIEKEGLRQGNNEQSNSMTNIDMILLLVSNCLGEHREFQKIQRLRYIIIWLILVILRRLTKHINKNMKIWDWLLMVNSIQFWNITLKLCRCVAYKYFFTGQNVLGSKRPWHF